MKYDCYTLIIENHLKSLPNYPMDFGWGQGYVLLPRNHPFYGKDYDDIDVDVHGGLTFGCKFESKNFLKWIKNQEIGGDVTRENFENFDGFWIIGFDTNHLGDNKMMCPKSYVLREAENLLEQCVNNRKYIIKLRKAKLKRIASVMALSSKQYDA